jgi:hypothetical protein
MTLTSPTMTRGSDSGLLFVGFCHDPSSRVVCSIAFA